MYYVVLLLSFALDSASLHRAIIGNELVTTTTTLAIPPFQEKERDILE